MIAFIFPGQGSQKINMISDFYDETIVGETFDEASDALSYDMFDLIESNAAKLNQTEFTQPAILTASIALYRLWQDRTGGVPDLLAGHSLGEYSALVAAEVLHFKDALKLVAHRGRLMQQAVPEGEGAMAAILGLNDTQVIEACEKAAQGEVVSAVNFNSPGQVVIAGQKAAVDRAIESCKALGAKRALPLPVSVPSHCALMKHASELLGHHFADVVWHTPKIPIVHNVDASTHESTEAIEAVLIAQLHNPVEWVKCVQKLNKLGANKFVECGPGKVLSGLNKRILPDSSCVSIEDAAGFSILEEMMA